MGARFAAALIAGAGLACAGPSKPPVPFLAPDDAERHLEPGPPAAAIEADLAPPGTVRIPALDRVVVGTPRERAVELIRRHPGLRNAIAAETPEHRVRVESFDLMVNEVTNEQYLAFVEATGHRPPDHWGQPAIDGARRAFDAAEAAARTDATESRGPSSPRGAFIVQEWWDANWRDAEWALPEELRPVPVTMVSYEDALAYARWAGLRLMTEAEYQAAARGEDADRDYPWGKTWDAQRATGRRTLPVPVGSHRLGASPHGVHDLVGNVWEWTSSPFAPLPGFEPIPERDIAPDSRVPSTETIAPTFNPDARVVVGASVRQDPTELRAGVRQRAARFQRTEALGFRCAATPKAGYDRARTIEVGRQFWNDALAYERVVAIDRWFSAPGSAHVDVDGENGYAVIEGYECILAVPRDRLMLSQIESRSGSVAIALVSTSLPVAEPALPPGDYVLAYRAEREGASYVFSMLDGHAVAELRTTAPRTVAEAPAIRPIVHTADDESAARDVLRFCFAIPSASGGELVFDLALEYRAGALAGDWRR